ncbi:MAG TPA: hypothetical protein VL443_08420 [Cyclobacteriaceae bacterium]|jgi:hypothetical protein|nr:hypothetical protein [Cyclobacteriaceae bacterium]
MDFETIKLKSGLFDRERQLIITSDHIEYENSDLIANGNVRLDKSDITDFIHSTDYIVWYKFTVGIKYSISLKSKNGEILKITFKSYFNTKREYREIYHVLVDKLHQYFFNDIVDGYLKKFYKAEEVKLGKLQLDKNGIKVMGTGLDFTWGNLSFKEYSNYFALARSNAPEFHIWIGYDEWFAEILYRLIKTIKRDFNS